MGRPKMHKDARLDETERYNVDQARLEKADMEAKAALAEWQRLREIAEKIERAFDAKWNPDFHRAPQPCPACGRNS